MHGGKPGGPHNWSARPAPAFNYPLRHATRPPEAYPTLPPVLHAILMEKPRIPLWRQACGQPVYIWSSALSPLAPEWLVCP